jgi:hypothetical protein
MILRRTGVSITLPHCGHFTWSFIVLYLPASHQPLLISHPTGPSITCRALVLTFAVIVKRLERS